MSSFLHAYMTDILFYALGILSIFASCLVSTVFFGCLLTEITMLWVLGRYWKQRTRYLAVGLLDVYVIWNIARGDICSMAYYILRFLDLHCHSPWCCRLLSALCLVNINNSSSVWAALVGFLLAPLGSDGRNECPFSHGETQNMSVFIYSLGSRGMAEGWL